MITILEHKKMGNLAKIFNDKLVHEEVLICNQSKTKSEGRRKASNHIWALKFLSRFRNVIEEIMVQDYPSLMNRKGRKNYTNIYYGERT